MTDIKQLKKKYAIDLASYDTAKNNYYAPTGLSFKILIIMRIRPKKHIKTYAANLLIFSA